MPDNYLINFYIFFTRAFSLLKKTGWMIFKADDITSKVLFPFCRSADFEFVSSVVWDKGSIGLGYYIRKQHELLEVYRPHDHKDSYFLYVPQRGEHKPKFVWHGGSKDKAFSSVLRMSGFNAGKLGGDVEKQKHINQTPVKLWMRLLRWFCPRVVAYSTRLWAPAPSV